MENILEYNVKFLRAHGLTVKWGRLSNGAPAIFGLTDSGKWAVIDNEMWEHAKDVGIKQAFDNHTSLIDFFSIAA